MSLCLLKGSLVWPERPLLLYRLHCKIIGVAKWSYQAFAMAEEATYPSEAMLSHCFADEELETLKKQSNEDPLRKCRSCGEVESVPHVFPVSEQHLRPDGQPTQEVNIMWPLASTCRVVIPKGTL